MGEAALPGALNGMAAGASRPKRCPGSLKDIEHIVILMQENRSFDQYFGTFPGVRGFGDRRNRESFYQRGYTGPGSQKGRLIPFHVNGKTSAAQCLGNLVKRERRLHTRSAVRAGRIKRRRDRIQPVRLRGANHRAEVHVTHRERLGERPVVRDVLLLVVGHHVWRQRLVVGRQLVHLVEAIVLAPVPAEQLQARGISWKSYTAGGAAFGQADSPFGAFEQFRNKPTLHRLGIAPTYPQDFLNDLAQDRLPSVSWIQVSFFQSEHPGASPALGEYAVDQVLRAIWRHPKIWRETAVIINHDENGGFFDHVPPPTAPPGTKGEHLTSRKMPPQGGNVRGPIGLGFRVPAIVVSPWTRGWARLLGGV